MKGIGIIVVLLIAFILLHGCLDYVSQDINQVLSHANRTQTNTSNKTVLPDLPSLPPAQEAGSEIEQNNSPSDITSNTNQTPTNISSQQENTSVKQWDHPIDYLIITRPMFLQTLEEFIRWKKETTNFTVSTLTAEQIDQGYSGRNIAEKIKNAIKNYSINNGTRYVLLVGDTKITSEESNESPEAVAQHYWDSYNLNDPWNIPTGYYLAEVEPGVIFEDKTYNHSIFFAAGIDFYYADLDEWDTNNDGVFKEDEVRKNKTGLEIYLGRWPVRTTEELSVIIRKTENFKSVREMLIVTDMGLPCSSMDPRMPRENWFNNCFPYVMFPSIPSSIDVIYMENTGKLTAAEIEARKAEIPSHFKFVEYSDNTDRQEILDAFFSKNRVIIELSHGNHDCIYPKGGICKQGINFTYIIPLFESHSCAVGTFFVGDEDSFDESLIKGEKGPVTVLLPTQSEDFYKLLVNSSTVGEAFYKTFDMRHFQGSGWNIFLGDPSIVIFQ